MSTTKAPAGAASRQQARLDTGARIVAAARRLLVDRGEVTLRAVARELGMTAPALYRYAASHEGLVRMVALAIDADMSARLTAAADRQPADDPAARLIGATVEFRHWALENREEFSLVFTNVDVDCIDEAAAPASCGMTFAGLLLEVWEKYRFPVPQLDDLDPELAAILRSPDGPAAAQGLPDELRGLVWLLERAWVHLYGTVALEVYRHVDPRIVEHALLFRAMIEDQVEPLGLTAELERLRPLMTSLLAARE
jgi:AcrR family transcriptional regulator